MSAPLGGPTFNPLDYGAVGDGSTNDSAAFASANSAALAANGTVIVTPAPGSGKFYLLQTTAAYSAAFSFSLGAQIAPSGATVTLSGLLEAPIAKIFGGTSSTVTPGTIVLTGPIPEIYAEWFGALCNGSFDDSLAIAAAAAALTHGGILRLLARPYTCKTAISVTNHSVTVAGTSIGPSPYDSGGGIVAGTQILGTIGINCIMANAVDYFKLHDVDISLATGATSASTAIQILSCFFPTIENVRTTNYSTGILLENNTDISIQRCYFSSKGVTVATVIGVDVNGSSHAQNATCYVTNCISAHMSYSGTAYGYYLHGNRINDTYFDRCEADGSTYGFYVDGSGVDMGFGPDIHLRGCVADGNGTYGYYIANFNVDSNLEIVNGWAAGGSTLIYIALNSACVRVSGMQVYGGANGIYVSNSKQAIITDNILSYQTGNGIVIDNSPVCTVANNLGLQKAAAGANFINLLSGSTHCSIMGNVSNAYVAGGFGIGVSAQSGCDFCNVIGNCIPSSATTTPYSLNLGSNPNTVQLGTTA